MMPSSPAQSTQAERQLPLRVVIAILLFTLVSLACTFLRPASRSASERLAHLPTLTRTPLPTLTPTPTIMSVALAMPFPAADATLNSATLPVNEAVELTGSLATSPQITGQSVSTKTLQPDKTIGSVTGVTPLPIDSMIPSATAPPTTPPTSTATATPLPSPTPTLTETPLPTSTSTATPTPTPIPEDWTFIGVQLYTDQYDRGLLLYGVILNNTGSAQELLSVTGTFYDAQSQVIASSDNSYAYWPGYVIPPGGSMPFELYVDGIDGAADFDLKVEANPTSETVLDNFEFLDLKQWPEDDFYCIVGKLRSPGGELQSYLIIAAILYDNQNKLVNYSDYQEFGDIGLGGDETSTFEICIDPLNQKVARYELLAWGQ